MPGWRTRTRSPTSTGADRAALCRAYLRDNIRYRLGPREVAGLRRYYELAAAHRLVDGVASVRFYED